MWRAVDEVGVGDDCGGEADDGAVEADDEDFWVRGEGFCDVEVEGYECLEPLFASFVGFAGACSADGDIRAAVWWLAMRLIMRFLNSFVSLFFSSHDRFVFS